MENYAAICLRGPNLAHTACEILEENYPEVRHSSSSPGYTTSDTANVIDTFCDLEKADYPREKVLVEAVQNTQEQAFGDNVNMLFSLFMTIPSFLLTTYWISSSYNPFYSEEASHITTIIPLLMILGPELVAKALAITTASPRNDSVCFGFGLLAYVFSLLTSAFAGFGEILPKPEITSKVLNLKSGQGRTNSSFVLSRVLRDLESRYVSKRDTPVIEVLNTVAPASPLSGLELLRANYQTVLVSVFQFLMACSYTFLSGGDCSVLCIFTTALFGLQTLTQLPAWRAQKFSARKVKGQNGSYALLRGNGHCHVFIIQNIHPEAWNLEDLAGSGLPTYDFVDTRERPVIFAVFLIFLLLTGLATQLSYFGTIILLVIMFYGTLGNLIITGLPRAPWAHGIALESVEVIQDDDKVIVALQSLEEKYPGFGEPLIKEFFPGGLREDEKKWWNERKEVRE
jgi:hypothetical protein